MTERQSLSTPSHAAHIRRWIGALAAAILLATSPPAAAATLSLDGEGRAVFTAGPSETNDVRFVRAGGHVFVSDLGAEIAPQSPCFRILPPLAATRGATALGEAACPATSETVVASLGSGDDRLSIAGGACSCSGGPGADRLTGSGSGDLLVGDHGADLLDGSGGDDRLAGGHGPDRLVGGPGTGDRAMYAGEGRTAGVRVSLDGGANDGGPEDDHADDVEADVEQIEGTAVADELVGNDAANVLLGEPDGAPAGGHDVLIGHGGSDVLDGGPGGATVSYAGRPAEEPVHVDLGRRTGGGASDGSGDTLRNVSSAIGGSGADTLVGDDADNVLDGGPGGDTIDGRGGQDAVSYGGHATGVVVDLDGVDDDGAPGENDRLRRIEDLSGGHGADVLTGDGASNVLNGRGGDDVLDGAAGADFVFGGNGTDTVSYASRSAGVYVNLAPMSTSTFEPDSGQLAPCLAPCGGGPEDLEAGRLDWLGGVERVVGGSGNDHLRGGNGDDDLLGGPGDDRLDGHFGADVLRGGDGTDEVGYAGRSEAVSASLGGKQEGSEGDRSASGSFSPRQGDDIGGDVENLRGGAGNDRLTGSAGANVVRGGGGHDLLIGGGGPDRLDGEEGIDTASYEPSSAAVTADLDDEVGDDGATEDGPEGARDTLISIEGLRGGSGDDRLTGSDGDDRLTGNGGDDRLTGGGGADLLFGNAGADLLDGADGAPGDQLDCGADRDVARFDSGDWVDQSCEALEQGGR